MKGLLVKDFRFLMQQKMSLIIFLGLGLYFMVTTEDVSMAMTYITMMIGIFTTGSIAYDCVDNGMAFLMTLPVQRKTYVVSKYVFALITECIMGVILCAMAYGVKMFQVADLNLAGLPEGIGMAIAMALIIAAILIPIYLKFGGEKARFALAVIFGLVFAVAFVMQSVAKDLLVEMTNLLNKWGQMPMLQAAGILFGIVAVLVGISMAISIAVVQKKEY